ncbi:hypothetical protein [Salinigranum sp.]|uniref:hypothetical protein n=1 Tax=Salinigranum sp. TaxID=1966351 RepID=UPI0035628D98
MRRRSHHRSRHERRDDSHRRGRTAGRTGRRSRSVALTGLVVWCLVVAAVVPGLAGAAVPAPVDAGAVAAVEQARGTSITVTASPATVAAGVGDSVAVTGTTTFEAGEVRLYLVGPRGRFLGDDGQAGDMEAARVVGGGFAATYESFSRRGVYRLLAVSPRGDGAFESTPTLGRDALPTDVTQQQAVDLVRAAYGRDEVVDLSLRAETPRLAIDPVSPDGTLVGDEAATVTGTTNRGGDATVFVDLIAGNGRTVATAETTVDAATGTWEVGLDVDGVEPGAYTLSATDGALRAETTVIVVTEESTPTETPAEDTAPVGTDADTDTDAVDEARATVDNATGAALANGTAGLEAANETTGGMVPGNASATDGENVSADGNANGTASANGSANGTANATAESGESTSGAVPGFGVGAFVAALVVVAVAVRRRTRGG